MFFENNTKYMKWLQEKYEKDRVRAQIVPYGSNLYWRRIFWDVSAIRSSVLELLNISITIIVAM